MHLRSAIRGPYEVARSLVLAIVTYTPGPFGYWLRRQYYRRRLKRCGDRVTLDVGVLIEHPELVSIGEDVHIDKYCILSTGRDLPGKQKHKPNPDFPGELGEIIIGNNVHIVHQCLLMGYGGICLGDRTTLSAGTKIYSLTNLAYDPDEPDRICSIMPYSQAPFLNGAVVLEDNVWLGLNVIVMPGVTLRRDSFVMSNAVVMHSANENSYLGGQPARRLRARFGPDQHVGSKP